MLTMLGSPRRCCDGLTRRETLRAGALSALGGFGLPHLHAAESAGGLSTGRAKNVILLYLLGGAATQDMWDLKPDGPAETRGEFRPIATSAEGISICEHLPQTSRWMHRAAIVRSVNHKAGCHNCLPSYCGYELPPADQHPRDTDPPSMGSVCEYLRVRKNFGSTGPESKSANARTADIPDYVYLPNWLGWGQAFRRAGPYGGFLGKRFDPLTTECEPVWDNQGHAPQPGRPQIVRGTPLLPHSTLPGELTLDRLNERRSLLTQFDDERRRLLSGGSASYTRSQQQAFDMLTSSQLASCFDMSQVAPAQQDRYGRTLFGQSTLIARRLLETGVRFINVTWDLYWDRIRIDYDAWDTHTQNFWILKHNKLPGFDQTFSALMEDLDGSGLLDETLIVVMSEMGRTPRINGNAGRDHWTYCYSAVFAGAGIRGGTVHGESDAQAAYVRTDPVSTSDICATIYSLLGIDPALRVLDRTGRPVEVAQGGLPISQIMS